MSSRSIMKFAVTLCYVGVATGVTIQMDIQTRLEFACTTNNNLDITQIKHIICVGISSEVNDHQTDEHQLTKQDNINMVGGIEFWKLGTIVLGSLLCGHILFDMITVCVLVFLNRNECSFKKKGHDNSDEENVPVNIPHDLKPMASVPSDVRPMENPKFADDRAHSVKESKAPNAIPTRSHTLPSYVRMDMQDKAEGNSQVSYSTTDSPPQTRVSAKPQSSPRVRDLYRGSSPQQTDAAQKPSVQHSDSTGATEPIAQYTVNENSGNNQRNDAANRSSSRNSNCMLGNEEEVADGNDRNDDVNTGMETLSNGYHPINGPEPTGTSNNIEPLGDIQLKTLESTANTCPEQAISSSRKRSEMMTSGMPKSVALPYDNSDTASTTSSLRSSGKLDQEQHPAKKE